MLNMSRLESKERLSLKELYSKDTQYTGSIGRVALNQETNEIVIYSFFLFLCETII